MTPTLHPYPAYRPSGVPWLDDVPAHWEVPRLKDVGYLKSGAGFPHSHQGNLSAEFPFFKVGDMAVSGNERLMQVWKHTVSSDTVNILGAHVFLPDTIVFAKVGAALLLNKRRVLTRPSCIDNNMMGFLPRGHSTEWMCHWLSIVDFRMVVNPGAVPSVNEAQLEVLPVLVPPLPEQRAIVRYLDYVDRRIRRYVDAKRKLIALLEEEKQTVVNRAVTRGLDPNVRLKPSGVDWLGDVPVHWDRCRLRNVVSVVTTGSRGWSSFASDTGPLFIRVANLNRGSLQLRFDDTVRLNLPETSEVTRTRIQASDLLVSVTAYIGSVGLAPEGLEEAYVSQHVARCQPLPGSSSRWLGYVLLSTVGQTHGQLSLYGGTKDGLSLDDVKNYQILLPPLTEQAAIVEYIDKSTVDIDSAIARARRQIELLQEYRTRLVADVVTGKLDIRAAAAQLPEEGDDQDPIEESGPLADGLDEALYDIDGSVEELAIESEVTA